MAFPENTPSPRLLQLAEKWKELGDFDKLQGLSQDDFAMIGDLIVLFGYIDLNLHRLAEVFDKANVLPPKWSGKTAQLFHMGDVSKAVQSVSFWDRPLYVERFRLIEEHRKLRNLCAHCAVRRFPDDDAFLFMFKSKRDYLREFGGEPAPGVAMIAINDGQDMREVLKNIELLQRWLAKVTSTFIAHLQLLPIEQGRP